MHITANRLELLSAARDAERIAPAQSPLDVLQCTYLATEDGKLTVAAGNLELALERRIPAEIHEEGRTVIDAALLSNMLRLLSGDTVSIRQESASSVAVESGHTTYHVAVLNAKDYPRMEIPFPEDSVSVTEIPAMTKRTVFAVSEDENKPQMKCVHLIFSSDGLRAVGSDGYRIAAARGDSKATGSVDVLIPASSLERLAQLIGNRDTLQVGTTGKTMVFLKDDFAFSARLVEGTYFDADQLLSRVHPSFTILTDAEQMRQTLVAVSTVTGKQNRFSITFKGSQLRMRCESENGVSSAEIDVVPLSGTPVGEYWYKAEKLMECLRAENGTLILELVQNGALILRTDELVCMQMATREPKPIEFKTKEVKPKSMPKKEKKAKKEETALPKAA